MGAQFTKLFRDSSKANIFKIGLVGVVLPVTAVFGVYKYVTREKDIIKQIVVSYDEQDSLDLNTVVAIMDAQFNIGRVPTMREEFNKKRIQILLEIEVNKHNLTNSQQREVPMFNMLQEGAADLTMYNPQVVNYLQPYITTVLDYDARITNELELNLDEICARLNLTKDEFNQSQLKHINNTNSHRLIGLEETLTSKIPQHLTVQRAKKIKEDMEQYAQDQFNIFCEFFQTSIPNSNPQQLDAELIMNQTSVVINPQDTLNDHLKAITIAKYLTIDQVLERSHGVNEAQLKRVLYKAYFDEIESKKGLWYKVRKMFK